LEILLWPNHGYTLPGLVPRHSLGARQTGLGAKARDTWADPAVPARNTRESVVGHFCGKDRIVKYCVVVLNYLFGVSKNSQLPCLASFWCEWLQPFARSLVYRKKSRVICGTDNGFPQEFRTVRFNLEPKRCKRVSLSAKRSVFPLVGLAHGVVTEKLRFPYDDPAAVHLGGQEQVCY